MMTNRAALYLRSSKDRSDISIDVQRRTLHELASTRGLVVVTEFSDVVLSGKDEDRPGFQQLLRAIENKQRGWDHLLAIDSSRIARRVFIIAPFERDLERRGITMTYQNLPDMEPAERVIFKSMMAGMDEYHSLKSRAKGLAGMAENIRQGWRAGGRAPRGYVLEYHATGAIRDGAPVLKSKLIPGPEAEQVAAYLRARAAGTGRGTALGRLGLTWSPVAMNGLEWQALTYAGHTVWGMHNELDAGGYVGGEKRKPRAQWTITRDTHAALITTAEAEAILDQLGKQRVRRTRSTARPYLLTGLLVSPDGQAWCGEWDGKMDAALYRLGRGKKIAARRVDEAVLAKLRTDLTTDFAIDQILRAMRHLVDSPTDRRAIAGAEKRLAAVVAKIARLVDQLADADTLLAQAIRRNITQLESDRVQIINELDQLRAQLRNSAAARQFTRADAARLTGMLFDGLQATIDAGEIAGIKAAIGDLVEKIELDPATSRCTIHYRIEQPAVTGLNLASPRRGQINPVRWAADVVLLAKRAA